MDSHKSSSHKRLNKVAFTVWIDLLNIFIELNLEIAAASRLGIYLARITPVFHDFWINELMIDHVLDLTPL